MDERRIEQALRGVDVPPPDENARKRALNLALAAFDEVQAEKEKRTGRQGFGWLGRLMSRSKPDAGVRPMKKRYLYGGMATAMTVVLAVAATYQTLIVTQQAPILAQRPKEVGATGNLHPSKGDAEIPAPPPGAGGRQTASPTTPPAPVAQTGRRTPIGREGDAASPKTERSREFAARPVDTKNKDSRGAGAKAMGGAVASLPAGSNEAFRADRAAPERSELRAPPATVPLAAAQPAPTERESAARGLSSRTLADRIAPPTQYRRKAELQKKQSFSNKGDVQTRFYRDVGRDQFQDFEQNPVKRVADAPVSTFSIDVDTASYAFMRRQINRGVLPRKDSVRIEEMINYFDYAYPLPETRERPFATTVAVTPSPWKKGNKLIHIGIKGYDIDKAEKPRSNLVFLLDVSGSMNAPDKLPLMVNSMKLLLDTLGPDDTVAIVVYAGAAGAVLEPTKAAEKHKILAALDRLRAGGSTAGAAGIRQAYALAEGTFDKNAVNRVILATDGDFNVGITNREELKDFVERKRKTGVFLSVLGFGQGNLNDHLMQTLAQNGNGAAAHIDTLSEARKVLVDEASSTLFPIAKDVKIQVEFNPRTVAEYRLIGYETRALKREDFNNDKVDAGDIGAGHTVTAIYEITPVGSGNEMIGGSRYAREKAGETKTDFGNEYAFLKVRYKLPKEDRSTMITRPITTADDSEQGGSETRWATAVAAFGQLLKGGKYTGTYAYDDVIALARGARGDDPYGYRAEFLNLVRLAKSASALPKN